MEARKNPEYLRSVQTAVIQFKEVLQEYLEAHVFNQFMARGIAPAILPREGSTDEQIARLATSVGQAAGRAAKAPSLTGCYYEVQGVGRVDPIAAWASMAQPKPILEPRNILDACDQMIGRLDGMILEAEAEAPPILGAEAMHPLIWGSAAPLWKDRHFRQAVAAAAESLASQVKVRTSRFDVAETALWQEVFSDKPPAPNKPRLRWPGDPTDRTVKNMNDGLRQFAPGVQMLVRNLATHTTGEWDEQRALENLATLSLLAGWVSQCDLVEADGEA